MGKKAAGNPLDILANLPNLGVRSQGVARQVGAALEALGLIRHQELAALVRECDRVWSAYDADRPTKDKGQVLADMAVVRALGYAARYALHHRHDANAKAYRLTEALRRLGKKYPEYAAGAEAG